MDNRLWTGAKQKQTTTDHQSSVDIAESVMMRRPMAAAHPWTYPETKLFLVDLVKILEIIRVKKTIQTACTI